jgi:hypothetical protein
VITTEPVRAWCLVNGEWVEREDPVMAVCDPYGGDVHAAMADLGYEAWCQIGVDDLPSVPVSLALYSREAPPLQFLLQLEGNAGNVVEHVFAETLPDAMELLARWAPIVRAGTPAVRTRVLPSGDGHAEDDSGHTGEGVGRPGRLEDDRTGRRPAEVYRPAASGSPAAVGRSPNG